jgi:MFS transporter, DHA2 family, multidrug resistance protein
MPQSRHPLRQRLRVLRMSSRNGVTAAVRITWVLTSYIVATAIFMSLSGWLAGRFGRRQVILWSVVGFTVTSALCGLATDLDAIVVFRFMQGAFGATLPPISQSILLDINPPERRAQAMSIWSLGTIVGPALGGWLTDNADWRWVFFINLPLGLLSFVGLFLFLSETRQAERDRLDFFGFAMIAIAISSLQLLLDRGQTKDWFSSPEIWVEGTCVLLFGYLFFVHTCTAQQPFLPPALCRDWNFLFGTVLGFFVGVTIFSMLTLQPPMLENLMGYPVLLTGLVTAPRGLTAFLSVFIAGRLMKLVDSRLLIFVGFMLLATSTYHVTAVSLQMDESLVLGTSLIQGLGTGFVFVPLATLSFSTLPPHLRDQGAAMYTLLRNLGGAFGISVIQAMTVRNAATVHSRLVEAIRPDNPLMAYSPI